jgi:hypothetical protein
MALTASDFRFMFPSTLLMQVMIVTFLFCGVAQKLGSRSDGRYDLPPT